MTLVFNTLSRFVIAILPWRKYLLISWLQWFLSPRKWNLILFSHFPQLFAMKLGPDAMIFIFECWILSQFFHSSFTFIKRLFSSSSLSAIKEASSVICISEAADISLGNLDSSLWVIKPRILHDVLCIEVKKARWQYTALMYSFPNFGPVCCPMSDSSCSFLIVYRFLRKTGNCGLVFPIL